MGHTQLLLGVDFMVGPSLEIVVAGKRGADDTSAMLRALQRPFMPNKVVVLRPEGEADAITKVAPYTEFQVAKDGKATAYVCQNFSCQQPTTDAEAMLESMLELIAGDE